MLYVIAALFLWSGGAMVVWAIRGIIKANKMHRGKFGERFAGVVFIIAGTGLMAIGLMGPSWNADYKDRVSSFNDRCHDVGGKVLSLDDHAELECWKVKLDVPYR
jgi:hypothetical protein